MTRSSRLVRDHRSSMSVHPPHSVRRGWEQGILSGSLFVCSTLKRICTKRCVTREHNFRNILHGPYSAVHYYSTPLLLTVCELLAVLLVHRIQADARVNARIRTGTSVHSVGRARLARLAIAFPFPASILPRRLCFLYPSSLSRFSLQRIFASHHFLRYSSFSLSSSF